MNINPNAEPECLHCVHAVLTLTQGAGRCTHPEALKELGEETVRRFLAGGTHDCPFFEDDGLPW